MTEVLGIGTLVALGVYLIVVAAGMRRAAYWPVWLVPFALTLDNLAFGVAGDYSGSLGGHAAEQALSSGLLALVGLYVGSLLPRAVPALQGRAGRRAPGRSRSPDRDRRAVPDRLIDELTELQLGGN